MSGSPLGRRLRPPVTGRQPTLGIAAIARRASFIIVLPCRVSLWAHHLGRAFPGAGAQERSPPRIGPRVNVAPPRDCTRCTRRSPDRSCGRIRSQTRGKIVEPLLHRLERTVRDVRLPRRLGRAAVRQKAISASPRLC